jgi:60 kDa SS-A/Ro ribonucleoprotein
MSRKYLTSVLTKKVTPQSEPIEGAGQVQNSAGGYSFAVDDWKRLRRFLILGSEGGSYYASERTLTLENATCVERCIAEDGLRAVQEIVEVSDRGLAPKNDPAIFALALASVKGDLSTRQAAHTALPKICRIGTHLFHFAEYRDQLGGWGRGVKEAVRRWYVERPADKLAMQVVKYGQRDGWCHRDLLRLAHPKTEGTVNEILHYAVNGWEWVGEAPHPDPALRVIWAAERAKNASEKELVRLIGEFDLPMEVVPTEKRTAGVYEAMLPHAGLTWLIRNLGNLSKAGVLQAGSHDNLQKVIARITDTQALKTQRVHPIQVLTALTTYKQGRGMRSDSTWPVVSDLVDALDTAFYRAFEAVKPAGKRFLLGLDVSGSMTGGMVAGVLGLTPRVASAAMAMVTKATEPFCHTMAFTGEIVDFPLSTKERLDTVCQRMHGLQFGRTDCAQPMLHAMKAKIPVDAFVVYTDSETWFGSIHPVQALHQYRQKMGIDARLIVVGMVSNGFTIADPNDPGMLDVVGFSSDAPAVISGFAAGEL